MNFDDGEFNGRYPNGSLSFDPAKFPLGGYGLASTIHSMGLKIGIYIDRCAWLLVTSQLL